MWHQGRMHLYHGTSTEHLESILRNGIQPREVTGLPSNWERDVPTMPGYVWLTAAYAVYYAVEAAGEGHDAVILRVDWDRLTLFPDEDFIAGHTSDNTRESWIAERAKTDPADYKELWSLSLERSGNVCTPSVPASAILDHRVIPIEGNGQLLLNTGYDAVPTELNYSTDCGELYRRCLDAYFENALADMPGVVESIQEDIHRKMLGDEGFEEMQKLMAEVDERLTAKQKS